MGWIIIGFLLFVIFARLSMYTDKLGKSRLSKFIGNLAFCSCFFCLILSFAFRGESEYKVVQKIDLLAVEYSSSFENETKYFFVEVELNDSYTYYARKEGKFGNQIEDDYDIFNLSGKNVRIVEDEGCETPQLIIYEKGDKITFWNIGFVEKEYVFYIPKGTVVRHKIKN